jgi:hypothetical protein
VIEPRLIHDEHRTEMSGIFRLGLGLLDVDDFLELTINGSADASIQPSKASESPPRIKLFLRCPSNTIVTPEL